MQLVELNGANIEYDVIGSGEPLLLIHGSILANAFASLLKEPSLANRYRLITYHRRGFAGSDRAIAPFTIKEQAADARALLQHLRITQAHVAGHSYGGVIATQLCLDAPELVHSLALLEPAFVALVPSGTKFFETFASIQSVYDRGDRTGATDSFLTGVLGPEYRPLLQTHFPPGAFEQGVADIDTFFQIEVPGAQQFTITAEDIARIRQPVLAVLGSESEPIFHEIHSWIRQRIKHAEELIVEATHALQYMNPPAVADGLARFLADHGFSSH